MKQIAILFLAGATFISCSKEETATTAESNVMMEEPVVKEVDSTAMAAGGGTAAEGLSLINGMDCRTCHKDNEKLVGPSYQEVADKYTDADREMLADKIVSGGVGNWGQVPMTPHAGLSHENALKMVDYIMSLKK